MLILETICVMNDTFNDIVGGDLCPNQLKCLHFCLEEYLTHKLTEIEVIVKYV